MKPKESERNYNRTEPTKPFDNDYDFIPIIELKNGFNFQISDKLDKIGRDMDSLKCVYDYNELVLLTR